MTKAPQDPWPRAARGLEIVLLPGTHQAAELDGCADMVIRGGEGVIIEGSIRPSGNEPPCTLRIHNGADRLQIVGPLELFGSEGRGLRITDADEIAISDVFSHHHGIEGIITGNCPRAIYRRIRCEDSVDSPDSSVRREYTPDKRHGIYISGNGSGSDVEGLKVARVTGSALQLNGAGMNAVIRELGARELEFYDCGSGGTPPLSMMALVESVIERFYIENLGNTNDRFGVMFADNKGAAYACYGNVLRDYTVPSGSTCPQEQGSARNTFTPGEGWSPEPPPEPEPEPPPEPDVQPYLDEIDDALRAIRRETHRAENALEAMQAALAGAEA